MNIQPDELIMLTSMIAASVLYVPFRWGVVKIRVVSRRHVSLPLFFVAWLLGTSSFGLAFPHLGYDWLPLGFAAALPLMAPGMLIIRWTGLFDWANEHTMAQGIIFLISAVVLNFLLYWAIDWAITSICRRVARRLKR